MDNFKVAIIGAGYMAREHIKAFASIPGVEIVGIHSRTADKAQVIADELKVHKVFESIEQMYQQTKADIVIIAVSELSVGQIAEEAFNYPWTCLIEKPAGYDYDDAVRIKEAADRSGIKGFVALNRRHYSSTRTVLADLEGLRGQRLIHVCDQEDPLAALASGRPEQVVRNWMYANSIHVVDYLRLFGRGEIESVDPIVRWSPENPCFVVTKIGFSSGDIGIYEAVWNGPGPWAATVTTQEKRWELRPLEQAASQIHGSRNLNIAPSDPWDTEFKPGLRVQAQEVLQAFMGKQHTLPSLKEGLETMHLVKAIYEI